MSSPKPAESEEKTPLSVQVELDADAARLQAEEQAVDEQLSDLDQYKSHLDRFQKSFQAVAGRAATSPEQLAECWKQVLSSGMGLITFVCFIGFVALASIRDGPSVYLLVALLLRVVMHGVVSVYRFRFSDIFLSAIGISTIFFGMIVGRLREFESGLVIYLLFCVFFYSQRIVDSSSSEHNNSGGRGVVPLSMQDHPFRYTALRLSSLACIISPVICGATKLRGGIFFIAFANLVAVVFVVTVLGGATGNLPSYHALQGWRSQKLDTEEEGGQPNNNNNNNTSAVAAVDEEGKDREELAVREEVDDSPGGGGGDGGNDSKGDADAKKKSVDSNNEEEQQQRSSPKNSSINSSAEASSTVPGAALERLREKKAKLEQRLSEHTPFLFNVYARLSRYPLAVSCLMVLTVLHLVNVLTWQPRRDTFRRRVPSSSGGGGIIMSPPSPSNMMYDSNHNNNNNNNNNNNFVDVINPYQASAAASGAVRNAFIRLCRADANRICPISPPTTPVPTQDGQISTREDYPVPIRRKSKFRVPTPPLIDQQQDCLAGMAYAVRAQGCRNWISDQAQCFSFLDSNPNICDFYFKRGGVDYARFLTPREKQLLCLRRLQPWNVVEECKSTYFYQVVKDWSSPVVRRASVPPMYPLRPMQQQEPAFGVVVVEQRYYSRRYYAARGVTAAFLLVVIEWVFEILTGYGSTSLLLLSVASSSSGSSSSATTTTSRLPLRYKRLIMLAFGFVLILPVGWVGFPVGLALIAALPLVVLKDQADHSGGGSAGVRNIFVDAVGSSMGVGMALGESHHFNEPAAVAAIVAEKMRTELALSTVLTAFALHHAPRGSFNVDFVLAVVAHGIVGWNVFRVVVGAVKFG